MILSQARGYDRQVLELLERAMPDMSPRQAKAWMDAQFDPESMFLYVQDGMVISCLQMVTRILHMPGVQMEAAISALYCTHPDFRHQGYFGRLLEAAIAKASVNQMVMLAVTDHAGLFEKHGFQRAASGREYQVRDKDLPKASQTLVYPWRSQEDLYPLYCRFLAHFPIHVQLDRHQFQEKIRFLHGSGKRIFVAFSPERQLEGFCIFSSQKDTVLMEAVVYDNSRALLNLLAKAAGFKPLVTVLTGPNEALHRIVPEASFHPKDSVMVRVSSWKHMSKWLDKDIRGGEDLFRELAAPMWLMLT